MIAYVYALTPSHGEVFIEPVAGGVAVYAAATGDAETGDLLTTYPSFAAALAALTTIRATAFGRDADGALVLAR